MVRSEKVQVGGAEIRKEVRPGRVGNKSIQSLQHSFWEFPFVIQGKFWTIRIQAGEVIFTESVSEIIDKDRGSWVASLLLVIVKNLIKISTCKPTNISVSMGRRNQVKKISGMDTVTLFGVVIKTGEIEG